MAFTGIVNIVKRKKTLHCGYKVRMGGNVKTVSACNCTWNLYDEVYEANASEVTCKRCQKLLEKANEDGYVKFGRR
ncbi:MAG: hypothetical protein H6Q69_5028 [Firmicutes bacterium]|nr:hypothetical protein [Bacillota bacterium]